MAYEPYIALFCPVEGCRTVVESVVADEYDGPINVYGDGISPMPCLEHWEGDDGRSATLSR